MADSNQDKTTESGAEARQRWVDEVQEALDRTGDAVRSAWDATRESRMSALESARQSAQELGEVIDKGIAAARERWAANEQVGGDAADATPPVEEVAVTSPDEEPPNQP